MQLRRWRNTPNVHWIPGAIHAGTGAIWRTMLCASLFFSCAANGADRLPEPYYGFDPFRFNMGYSGGHFTSPGDASGYIEQQYATVPWHMWLYGGPSVTVVTLYCTATVPPYSLPEISEASPPQQQSAYLTPKPIFRLSGQCSQVNNNGNCIAAQCLPDPLPWEYAILAYCPNSDLRFRSSPSRCECADARKTWSDVAGSCVTKLDRWHAKVTGECFGNPIYPLTGSKREIADFGRWLSVGGSLAAVYDTRRAIPNGDSSAAFEPLPLPSFGAFWESTVHKRLVFRSNPAQSRLVRHASRGAGEWVTFERNSSGDSYDGDVNDRLVPLTGGWRYVDAKAGSQEIYDLAGMLRNIAFSGGGGLTYSYSDSTTSVSIAPVAGLLMKVQDHFGRSVSFEYEQPVALLIPRIRRIIGPDGNSSSVTYDTQNNLIGITWSDAKVRQFLYDSPALSWALTGIIDENGRRYSTYGYDDQGRANSTEHAGGAGHYGAAYAVPPAWNIVETYDPPANVVWRDHYWKLAQGVAVSQPTGGTIGLTAELIFGMPRTIGRSQAAGAGCDASTSAQGYDSNGNPVSRDDFNGNRTCHAHDLSRNLEASRVEGLPGGPSGTACSAVTNANTAIPAGSRKTSTQWHPDWQLKTRVAEPGRLTTYVYNGQPDPYAGNALASCAPASALLPDNKPIAMLCRQVEQATTDADGSQGFSAAPQAAVPSREQRWAYNQYGQVLIHDGPRTDINDITTYAYYGDTTADHTLGDLMQVINAAGQPTLYTRYNRHGQALEMIDPNGIATAYTYDLRQRLTSVSIAGQTTVHEYWPTGLLKRTTQPDGSHVAHEYDDAHRQTAVADNLGNRIEYQLDNAGNRIAENIKDPSGGLRRQLTRSIDALGRVQQTTGRE